MWITFFKTTYSPHAQLPWASCMFEGKVSYVVDVPVVVMLI